MAKSSKPGSSSKKPAASKPKPAAKASKGAGGKSSEKKASTPTKPATKAVPAKKPAPAAAKPAAKPATKAAAAKPTPKPAAKPAAKPATKAAPKADSKAPAAKAPPVKPAAAAAPAPAPAAIVDGKKVPPKGITIVQNRPMRKPKPKKLEMPASEPLLKAGAKWKPLIPSGPKAPPTGLIGQQSMVADPALLSKNKLPKRELDKYREILLRKRSELVGDVANIEDEALRQNSGSLSSLPQHMAEQGSDTFEQSISLDLAQVDRNLIREIDDALRRIEDGTYGLCLRSGERISSERLAEIPWAKYSIEAQRDLERRPYFRGE